MITSTSRRVGSGELTTRRVHMFDSVLTAIGIPSRPRQVDVTPRRRAAVVTWGAPRLQGRQPIERYRVDVRRPSGAWRVVARVDDVRDRVVVRGLARERRYEVRVVAVNRFGPGLRATSGVFRTR